MNKTVFERRSVSLGATQQIAMVAKMMALRFDSAIPEEAALLESLERALYRLRKESTPEPAGNDDSQGILLRGEAT